MLSTALHLQAQGGCLLLESGLLGQGVTITEKWVLKMGTIGLACHNGSMDVQLLIFYMKIILSEIIHP
jgi:hypothetical protein